MSKHVNLDELIDPGLSVTLDGQTVPALPIDGVGMRIAGKMKDEGSVDAMYDLVARCLPSIARERIDRLTVNQASAIIELVSEGVNAVEAAVSPNSGPAGARETKKA